jgi:Superinfection immunity protein
MLHSTVLLVLIFLSVGGGIYFLPTIIAVARQHHNALAIFLLNLLLGWTVLGWVGSLVWSATAVTPAPRPTNRRKEPYI